MPEPQIDPRTAPATPIPAASSLIRSLGVKDGQVCVRPIRHEDAPALIEMIRRADPADVRSRFHVAMREPPPELIERLTDLDYTQHMALAAWIEAEIVAVARLVCDPGCGSGEFALAVRSDQQRRGIGRGLMGLLLDYARARGMVEVWGSIEIDNDRMLQLAKELGFRPQGLAQLGEQRLVLQL
jgi:acetyltransferase